MAEDQRKKQQQQQDDEITSTPTTSTEYIVHNWLEALFAWFQVIVLWHEPQVSLFTISGILSSFLLLTYLTPRFYATLLMAIFIYNLNKFWFRHVWPEIRLPPGHDRDLELRADVDRFTLLHPHLMTLKELNQYTGNLMKIVHYYWHKLLLLRQHKPAAFCSLLCTIFTCSAYLGSLLSGLSLILLTLIIIICAPGIYTYLIRDEYKIELHHHLLVCLEQIDEELKLSQIITEQHEHEQALLSSSGSANKLIGTLLDNFKTKSLQLFTSVPISNLQSTALPETSPETLEAKTTTTTTTTSRGLESSVSTPLSSSSSMLSHLKEDGVKVLYNLIDVTLMSGAAKTVAKLAESQRQLLRRTDDNDDDDDDELSKPLISGQNEDAGGGGGDDDDGFVILG